MRLDPLDKQFIDSMLPHGTIPTGVVCVITYIDQSGDNRWKLWLESDIPITGIIGALELAKIDIIASTPGSTLISEPYEEDDL